MCSTPCDCSVNGLAQAIQSELSLDAGKPSVKPCRKCGAEPFIVMDKIHVECRRCFLESCNRKLRSTIGKSKLIRNNDSILIAYSGGASSNALLDLISNSMSCDTTRREQKFRPSILHIDMKSVFNPNIGDQPTDGRCKRLKVILNYLKSTYPSWPVYWTTIEMASSINDKDKATLSGRLPYSAVRTFEDIDSISEQSHLLSVDSKIHEDWATLDLTDRQQLFQDRCAQLINYVADLINLACPITEDRFKYVFLASSSTQLANNLLVNVILGRGDEIKSTVSVCDPKPAVPLMRPMRDFSKKEVAFYLRARRLDSVLPVEQQINLLTVFAKRKASIHTATEAFLSKLYVDYPSTYSTLLRTGNKMQD